MLVPPVINCPVYIYKLKMANNPAFVLFLLEFSEVPEVEINKHSFESEHLSYC